jgi:tetratricopeptide (TPR) repeat protein
MARIIFCLMALVGLTSFTGCEPANKQSAEQIEQQVVAQENKVENLREAMRFVDNLAEYNRAEAIKEVGYQLNAWMATDSNQVSTTKIPELIRSLPEDVRSYPPLSRVDSREFTQADVGYLMQSRLFAAVAKWSSLTPMSDAIWKDWLQKPEIVGDKPLSEVGISDLQLAYKFFDWSIRNVQLSGDAKDVEVLSKDPRLPLNDNALGYRQLPWQTMMFGRGDFIERGRVFAELARQKNIETVWLAIGKVDSLAPPALWLMGVPIDDEIFLFDSKLGIPIPGPDQTGIATLRQALEDESILRRLSISGRFKYPLDTKGAQSVIALIDAEPSMISGRMKRLQESLTSDLRTELYMDVDSLAEKLKKHPKLQAVQCWPLSIMSRMYADDLEQRLKETNEFTARYLQEHLLYMGETPVIQAKYHHLLGHWENSLDEQGAMSRYMSCRVPEEDLAKLPYDTDMQQAFEVQRLPNEPVERFNFRLNQVVTIYREAKIDATYLIGLLHFDQNNLGSSTNWLIKRAQVLKGFERWQPSIWYNAARAYEAEGKLQEALEMLRQVPSPQEAGNRLRMRLLQKSMGEGAASPEAEPPGQ